MKKLWLDLGNTRLKYWMVDDDNIIAHDAKEHLKAPNELLLGLLGTLASFKPEFVGISSVLGDKINHAITQTLQGFNVPFEFAKVNATHQLLVSHYNPTQLGVDRWLQMLGVVDDTKKQCVVGCGTALTIDLIEHGTHLGGYILPNVYMQRHALYAGTQQIAVKAGRFDSTELGRTTFDAVNHGVLFGVVGAVRAVRADYPDFKITLTGGGADMINMQFRGKLDTQKELLLAGLRRYFS
ncbi:type III pantothenate kinase [Moraxella nonliquefaciens]|jgi:type III pantothenate kinase|uniref:type III pantothenate kinase n=1 Tax=Moraxella nonliquefaciens TaxID=478 RepID=UPI00081EABE7|nr:type III pantothenate kinase [Moraxella nonliquefaciens]OBX50040.1 pantothenate kinase [Moraxella nonliquefaciens]